VDTRCGASASTDVCGNGSSPVEGGWGFGETARDLANHAGFVEGRPSSDCLDCLSLTAKLHASFDRIQRMAHRRFDKSSESASDKVHKWVLLLWSIVWLLSGGGRRHGGEAVVTPDGALNNQKDTAPVTLL